MNNQAEQQPPKLNTTHLKKQDDYITSLDFNVLDVRDDNKKFHILPTSKRKKGKKSNTAYRMPLKGEVLPPGSLISGSSRAQKYRERVRFARPHLHSIHPWFLSLHLSPHMQ